MNQKNPPPEPLPVAADRQFTDQHIRSLPKLWPEFWLCFATASQISVLAAISLKQPETGQKAGFP